MAGQGAEHGIASRRSRRDRSPVANRLPMINSIPLSWPRPAGLGPNSSVSCTVHRSALREPAIEQSNTAEICVGDHAFVSPRHGFPVLRLDTGREVVDLMPTDSIGDELAADFVIRWARQPDRTDVERHAASQFLRQWPTGPQL